MTIERAARLIPMPRKCRIEGHQRQVTGCLWHMFFIDHEYEPAALIEYANGTVGWEKAFCIVFEESQKYFLDGLNDE